MDEYVAYLESLGLADRTVDSYRWTAEFFMRTYGEASRASVLAYRDYLLENFKPQTVNQRIQAMNRFLSWIGRSELRMKCIRMQQRGFLENVISNDDYVRFKDLLRIDGRYKFYFAVWLMAATGARVSELLQFTVEDMRAGYVDLCSKGAKMRRLYVPQRLRREVLEWVRREGRTSGGLFMNRYGRPITARGLAQQLKTYAREYGINEQVVHPHSFRHLYARNFIDAHEDIALLADLMGHGSIETTRVYLRKTACEQRDVVERVVVW